MTHNDGRIFNLTVAEFKAFKRAVQVLCRIGLTGNVAIQILLDARDAEMENRRRFKSCG